MTLLAVTAFLTKRSPECLNQLCIVIIADPVHPPTVKVAGSLGEFPAALGGMGLWPTGR